jgi:hypothetical protein
MNTILFIILLVDKDSASDIIVKNIFACGLIGVVVLIVLLIVGVKIHEHRMRKMYDEKSGRNRDKKK